MTQKEFEDLAAKMETYNKLTKKINQIDSIIDAIDARIDDIGPSTETFVTIGVDGYGYEIRATVDQLTKLKELLDSWRYDSRKCLEEL